METVDVPFFMWKAFPIGHSEAARDDCDYPFVSQHPAADSISELALTRRTQIVRRGLGFNPYPARGVHLLETGRPFELSVCETDPTARDRRAARQCS